MISIELSNRFKKRVRESRREAEVLAALKLVADGFGKPHAHSGLAIRNIGKTSLRMPHGFGVAAGVCGAEGPFGF